MTMNMGKKIVCKKKFFFLKNYMQMLFQTLFQIRWRKLFASWTKLYTFKLGS